jgi:hypothetical protein
MDVTRMTWYQAQWVIYENVVRNQIKTRWWKSEESRHHWLLADTWLRTVLGRHALLRVQHHRCCCSESQTPPEAYHRGFLCGCGDGGKGADKSERKSFGLAQRIHKPFVSRQMQYESCAGFRGCATSALTCVRVWLVVVEELTYLFSSAFLTSSREKRFGLYLRFSRPRRTAHPGA